MIKNETENVVKSGERNDCAVVALANVLNISYAEAHARWESAGRTDNQGTNVYRLASKVGLRPSEHGEVKYDATLGEYVTIKKADCNYGRTIKTFADNNPVGRYFVMMTGHCLAICDGKVIDERAERVMTKHVQHIYVAAPTLATI